MLKRLNNKYIKIEPLIFFIIFFTPKRLSLLINPCSSTHILTNWSSCSNFAGCEGTTVSPYSNSWVVMDFSSMWSLPTLFNSNWDLFILQLLCCLHIITCSVFLFPSFVHYVCIFNLMLFVSVWYHETKFIWFVASEIDLVYKHYTNQHQVFIVVMYLLYSLIWYQLDLLCIVGCNFTQVNTLIMGRKLFFFF